MNRYATLAGGIVGVGLVVALLHEFGMRSVLGLLSRTGVYGMLALIAFHPLQMLCSAWAWRAVAAPLESRIGLATWLGLRSIREAVNNLLPLAQVGGEVVAARLLERCGVRLAPAVAGTVADLTLEMASQVLFTLLGILLLLREAGGVPLVRELLLGLGAAVVALAGGFLALRAGLGQLLERTILRLGRAVGWARGGEVSGLNTALLACYHAPRRVLRSLAGHLGSWLLGGVEVCMALHFLGHTTRIGPGLAIESIGQALKAVGFAVPGALGIQEGGYIIICAAFGISPQLAIGLSLLKRLREVVLGISALLWWRYFVRKSTALGAVSPPRLVP